MEITSLRSLRCSCRRATGDGYGGNNDNNIDNQMPRVSSTKITNILRNQLKIGAINVYATPGREAETRSIASLHHHQRHRIVQVRHVVAVKRKFGAVKNY